jgi:hypothetical protein
MLHGLGRLKSALQTISARLVIRARINRVFIISGIFKRVRDFQGESLHVLCHSAFEKSGTQPLAKNRRGRL